MGRGGEGRGGEGRGGEGRGGEGRGGEGEGRGGEGEGRGGEGRGGEGRGGEGRGGEGSVRHIYTVPGSEFLTHSENVVPDRGTAEINMKVRVTVLHAHQAILLHLWP